MKVLSVAPTRLSLFGGGTDVSPYCDLYGGLCINMAINLRQNLTMYSGEELFELTGKSVFPYGANPDFYYQMLEEYGINDGVHLTKLISKFDGLIESGIGSSASAAVALLGAINKRKNLGMSLNDIAEKAWELEVKKLSLYGGRQDQYASVYGGVNVMEFKKGGGVNVTPLAKGFVEPLFPSLALFYTGKNRKSATIQEGFKELDQDQIGALNRIKKITIEAIDPIAKGDFRVTGALLDEAWEWKKLSNKGVTNPEIDAIYTKAKELGAYGGKILGAGSGGFILFIVDPKERDQFIKKLGLEHWDFSVDFNGLEVRDITNK
jgi:D-glycero-alpha-D-manno-heptose-7-phosphate kinase